MNIKDLKDLVPKQLFNVISKEIEELRPPQEEAIKKDLLKGKDLLVSSPTASGKTLIAELTIIKNILEGKGKGIYIVPLKSLANEKYVNFKRKYEKLGIKIAISVGNYDSSDGWLKNYDLIITTSEKLDSLIRHNAKWIKDIKTIVIDECHLINDTERGPTLEVLITLLKLMLSNAQFIFLSATINNSKEISKWLNSNLIKSNYRPVKLKEGVIYDNQIFFKKEVRDLNGNKDSLTNIIEDTLLKNKQMLIFVSSRRNTESLAEKLNWVSKYLNSNEKNKLKELSKNVKNVLNEPSIQCKKLSNVVLNGVAFHHAGLLPKQKNLIEDEFKKGNLKVIVATTTLAMGVNLPAYRVLIKELRRYTNQGYVWIPIIEYKQMAGRAGRPDYDKEGEALTIAKTEFEKDLIFKRYVNGKIEDITSKLGVEPILRRFVLSLIASNICNDKETLNKFFKKTLYAFQFKNIDLINQKITNIIRKLKRYEFIEEKNNLLLATKIGKRISQLYIDPNTGYYLIKNLRKLNEFSNLGLLHLVCRTYEVPNLNLSNKEFIKLQLEVRKDKNLLIEKIPDEWSYEWEYYLRAYKTALMILDWINEKSYDYILENYNFPPGSLYNLRNNIDWVLYSCEELCKLLNKKELISKIKELRIRVKYGAKKELLPLLSIKGIGRVKARKLYNAGIKNLKELKKAPFKMLKNTIGESLSKKIKEEL